MFLTVYQYLSHLAGITIKLQSSTLDIIGAYKQIDEVKQFYKELRENITVEFHSVFQQAERMGVAVNVEPTKPRTCARQMHRPNADAESVEDWYRVNVAIPFIDHIITELESQFSSLTLTASQLLGLVPSVICSSEVDVSNALQLYCNDLPSPELFNQEFIRWKYKYTSKPSDQRPTTCASALKACDKLLYPNIFVLLQIACTLPVTSSECERNASTLRRLRNFMRAGMTEDRLTSLALMTFYCGCMEESKALPVA